MMKEIAFGETTIMQFSHTYVIVNLVWKNAFQHLFTLLLNLCGEHMPEHAMKEALVLTEKMPSSLI